MRFWLNTRNREWGILKGGDSASEAGSRTRPSQSRCEKAINRHPWMRQCSFSRDSDLVVLEKETFVKLYEVLERMSLTPVYSPVHPTANN